MKTDKYKFGDCFEFKDSIKDFGLVFVDEQNYPDGKQYHLFPVKLDTTKIGIEKFKDGHIYVTSFPDATKSTGRTDGFMVYYFIGQKDFTLLNNFFNHAGFVQIKNDYKNVTGGTSASTMADFRAQLSDWKKMFGDDGKLLTLNDLSP